MRAVLLAIGLLGIFLETGVAQVPMTILPNGAINMVNITTWDAFNCRRPSPQPLCSGNGVCQPDGSCQCNSNFGGDDCSLDLAGGALVLGNDCTPQCQNGGQCYRPNGAADTTNERCYCPAAFRLPAGEPGAADCSLPRVQLTCRAGDMAMLVYPQLSSLVGYAGEFAAQFPNQITTLSDASCSASVANPRFDWNGNRFSFTFSTVQDASNPCVLALQLDSTAADGTLTLCYDTRLYYSDQIVSGVRRFLPTDELFRFCCDESTSPPAATVPVGTETGQDGSGAQVDSTIDILSTEIVYTDNGAAAPIASRPIGVGTPLSFVVAFADAGTRYNDIRILNCVSNPGGLDLILAGCPNPNELSVIVGIRKDLPNDRAFVDILAYRSTNDNNLQITCQVQVCVSTCVNPIPLCDGTGVPNIGRKRRQAELPPTTNDTETLSVSRTIVITVGEPAGQVEGPTRTEPCDCAITSEVFIPVAVVFGALLMVVMTIAIFLCVRSSARNRDSKGSA